GESRAAGQLSRRSWLRLGCVSRPVLPRSAMGRSPTRPAFASFLEGGLPGGAPRQPERAPARRPGLGGEPVRLDRPPTRGVPHGCTGGVLSPGSRSQPPVGCVKKHGGRGLLR